MRPRKLTLQGFTAFKSEVEIDFTKLGLFAISGPTGAGKSSLLDAMTFALFGEVPRVKKNISELISHGSTRMSVSLEFEANSTLYRVVRVAYSTATASRAQLERIDASGKEIPLAEGITAVTAEIKRILSGLDFDTFVQSVLLPQGEFARFLKSKGKEQRDILSKLLRLQLYENMRKTAEERRKHHDAEVTRLADVLGHDYADATPEILAQEEAKSRAVGVELEHWQQQAHVRQAALSALQKRYELHVELQQKRRALAEHEQRDIESARRRLDADERASRVLGYLDAVERARDAALAAGIEPEEATVEAIDAAIREVGYSGEVYRSLVAARDVADRLEFTRDAYRQDQERYDASLLALRDAEASHRDALHEQGKLDKAYRRVQERLTAVHVRMEEAERRHQAVLLRAHLHVGQACPVCMSTVHDVPASEPVEELDELRASLQKAEREAARAQARLEQAGKQAGNAGMRLEMLQQRLDQETAQLGRREEEVARYIEAVRELPGPWPAEWPEDWLDIQPEESNGDEDLPEVRIREALDQAEQGKAEHEALTAVRRAVAAALAEGFGSLVEARSAALAAAQRQRLRHEVATWADIHASLRARITELEAAVSDAAVDLQQVEAAQGAAREALARERELIQAQSALGSRIAELSKRIDKARERRTQLEHARAQLGLYKQLAAELRSDGFQDYLLERIFLELARGASRRLFELSGRYTLEFRGSSKSKRILVLDHDNAREQRSADTLSGGETFLTSLALALELSEQIQRAAGAVRLDSLFIDEGFGTLDAETLETVTSVIEALGSSDRMVGIITHLRELTVRMPARIEVDRRPEGSRVEVLLS